ncbi:putative uncharacterized protein DDB_G0277255 [Panonychus citri]|uniref:putative uncharacterized protein DDB_G0277255 n=1 Tax=Panonychus citri TaxID=50023 RepID=UPI002307C3E1|nr:putative uncharacterized protein DDB_G0277255 [Panonychus citri]
MLSVIVVLLIIPLVMEAQQLSTNYYRDQLDGNGLSNQWISQSHPHPHPHHLISSANPSTIPSSQLVSPSFHQQQSLAESQLSSSPSASSSFSQDQFQGEQLSPYNDDPSVNPFISNDVYLNQKPMIIDNNLNSATSLSQPQVNQQLPIQSPSPLSSLSPLIQTPIQRRLFNPINRIILTLLGPRLMRYQMDMVVQAVMSEVIRKMIGPVLTAIAGRFVDPNGQQNGQHNQLNPNSLTLSAALNSLGAGNGGGAGGGGGVGINNGQQQQQHSIPQITLVPNQLPNGQIQLIIKPGGGSAIDSLQQQQQLTNLQQLTQSLIMPVTPTPPPTSSPLNQPQLYSSAQLQATLNQQIAQQLAGKLPEQLIPQVSQQIQAQLQDKLPNIHLQVQQQLSSQLANLQQQLGVHHQQQTLPMTAAQLAPPTTNSPASLASLSTGTSSIPLPPLSSSSSQPPPPSTIQSSSPTSSSSNGIQTILVQPMSGSGLTGSPIYGSINPQSSRAIGLDSPSDSFNYNLVNSNNQKSIENMIGSYYVKLNSPTSANQQQQSMVNNQQYYSQSNNYGQTDLTNSGQLMAHHHHQNQLNLQSPNNQQQQQQFKVILNPVDQSDSNLPEDGQSNPTINQQHFHHHQQQPNTFYSTNNQQMTLTPQGGSIKSTVDDNNNNQEINNVNPISTLVNTESTNLDENNNNLTTLSADINQYNNIRNIIQQNEQNQINSNSNSESESNSSNESKASNDGTISSTKVTENSSSSSPSQLESESPNQPESTQETQVPITSYSHGSGYKVSRYPPIPETRYQSITDENVNNNNNNLSPENQYQQSTDTKSESESETETQKDESNVNENDSIPNPLGRQSTNNNNQESQVTTGNIDEKDNHLNNNEINDDNDTEETVNHDDLPEHLKHMRSMSRDNLINNFETNQRLVNQLKNKVNSGLTEIEEAERAIRWNTVLKNLDKYNGIKRLS